MKRLGLALALALAVCASAATSASAAPRLVRVKNHLPRGVQPAAVVVAPEGTAYVQGGNLKRHELVPYVLVFSPSGKLTGKVPIPVGLEIRAFGNGQLYAFTPTAEHVCGLNPKTGARVSEVGALPMESFPGNLGFPTGVAVGPGGTIYESGGELSVAEPGNLESRSNVLAIHMFNSAGSYVGSIQPQFATTGGVTVIAVNASGDVLGYWVDEKGVGTEGVLSPQGAELEHFIDLPPRPEVQGGSFGANSNSIYAGVVQSHGVKGKVFVAQVSLTGRILQRFGIAKAHDVSNPWEYGSVQVAPNGEGWALRVGTGGLYRFHV